MSTINLNDDYREIGICHAPTRFRRIHPQCRAWCESAKYATAGSATSLSATRWVRATCNR